jgi:hypothetical protein
LSPAELVAVATVDTFLSRLHQDKVFLSRSKDDRECIALKGKHKVLRTVSESVSEGLVSRAFQNIHAVAEFRVTADAKVTIVCFISLFFTGLAHLGFAKGVTLGTNFPFPGLSVTHGTAFRGIRNLGHDKSLSTSRNFDHNLMFAFCIN